MKHILLLLATLIVFNSNAQVISEIHYDNNGSDIGEMIEVTTGGMTIIDGDICDSPLPCGELSIELINGTNGEVYATIPASNGQTTTIPFPNGNAAFVTTFSFSGIQNGSPDGIALICNNGAEEFLLDLISYEGTITVSDPGSIANGLTTTDIGVSENNSTPVGNSLQRNFITGQWEAGPESFGVLNPSAPCLALPITLSSFTAEVENRETVLKWTTLSEENNDFFEVLRSFNGVEWERIHSQDGAGSTNQAQHYSAIDKSPINGTVFYQLKQTDFDGAFTFSDIISVSIKEITNTQIISANRTSLNILTNLEGQSSYRVYNSLGNIVATDEFLSVKGNQSIYFKSGELSGGFYIIDVVINRERTVGKFVIN